MADTADRRVHTIAFEDRFELPAGVDTFDAFRRWTWSPDFPEAGRVDWIDGRIEVDMQADNLFEHNTPKGEFDRQILNLVRHGLRGRVFTDGAGLASPLTGLSCEPDLIFILAETIETGAVTYTPTVDEREHSYIEVVGPVDVVLEIVSDSSVTKDHKRLPAAYFNAGVTEFWTLDARRNACDLRIHRRELEAFEPVVSSDDGFQWSDVFGRAFRLERFTRDDGEPDFLLHIQPPVS